MQLMQESPGSMTEAVASWVMATRRILSDPQKVLRCISHWINAVPTGHRRVQQGQDMPSCCSAGRRLHLRGTCQRGMACHQPPTRAARPTRLARARQHRQRDETRKDCPFLPECPVQQGVPLSKALHSPCMLSFRAQIICEEACHLLPAVHTLANLRSRRVR